MKPPCSRCRITAVFAVFTLAFGFALGGFASEPLTNAHAHNDYEHQRPLLDALDQGFCSVEADIFLVGGKLLVAHTRDQVSPGRTLQKLYLDPLRERVRQNGGRVYRDGPPVWLLIDLKTDPGPAYAALREVLESYADILTSFGGSAMHTNAINIVITGHRLPSAATFQAETVRYAGLDGQLRDLDADLQPSLMPWISEDWRKHFKWRGTGPLPDEERKKLKQLVERIHRSGRLARFWSAPDTEDAWREFRNAGVDLLNTDDLAGMNKFLRQPGK
jgi:hypothetical protein